MKGPFDSVWWVIGLPLIGFLVQALVGKRVVDALGEAYGKRLMGALAVLPIAGAFAIGVKLTTDLAALEPAQRSVTLQLFDWITLKSINIPFEVLVDPLSLTMVLIITGVGALIHLYATGYMAEERDYTRFFTYLNLFIAFMLVLVLGNNLAMLFIGWEGVGLCSYLLIGFWYKDLANARAANKAFIVNRIGDYGLTLGMFLIVATLAANADRLGVGNDPRWLSYDVLLPNAVAIFGDHPAIATAVALLLFVGAMGKSAQFPLYLWLPDAMAGPTPVSALIHAATMVTAGVFLLNRLHVLFELSPFASAIVAAIGAFTALFAALVAFGQTDIKKVLAYSTVSQLGFMFIACGAGAYWVGMFHVTTHAFFKALLFLGAGAVIHAMVHEQDMRRYGNLLKYVPITGATMIVGWLAIAGVPPLAGFWSKEGILGGALAGNHAVWNGANVGVIAGWVGLGCAALTAMYMTRLTIMTFFGGEERWREVAPEGHAHAAHAHAHAHEHHTHEPHPDPHGFFMTDEEVARRDVIEGHEHHHDLSPAHEPREVPPSMWIPLAALAVLSLGGGLLLHLNHTFEKWLVPAPLPVLGEVPLHPHGIPLLWLSIGAAALGIVAGLAMYWRGLPESEGWDLAKWRGWRRAASNQFGYDQAMVDLSVKGGNVLGTGLWKGVDAGLVDGAVNATGYVTGLFGKLLRKMQTGYVRGYAMLTLLGTLAILGFLAYALTKGAVL